MSLSKVVVASSKPLVIDAATSVCDTAPTRLRPPDAPAPKIAAVETKSQTQSGLTRRIASFAGRLPNSVLAVAAGASMTAFAAGAPVYAQSTTGYESVLSESILNPGGTRNVTGSTDLFAGSRIAQAPDRVVMIDPSTIDPSTVMATTRNVSPEVRRIIAEGGDNVAERVADALAAQYGGYTADNSEENRQAIIENLRWLASSGVHYNHDRADTIDPTTQSPNQTFGSRSGVCRDTHIAAAAVLSSLMNAREVDGRWQAGSPTGQEANVQVVNFATANEHHAFAVFRNPGSGGWDALEYGRSYELGASTAAAALHALPGNIPGYSTFAITGWDSNPVIADRRVIDAAVTRNFMMEDAGVGTPGQVRLQGSTEAPSVTAFITPELSITGQIQPSIFANNTIDGGIKLNYHQDFRTAEGFGYSRIAGGVYTTTGLISDTGRRALSDREEVRTYAFVLQQDRRFQSHPREIFREHLQWRYGYDSNMTIGVPLGPDGPVLGAIQDYSSAQVGADAALLGREVLGPNLTLDWAVQGRYEVDILKASQELFTSQGTSFDSLGIDALRTDFAFALTHEGEDGLRTRFEAGGTQWLASPLDPDVTAQGSHYAVMSLAPQSGVFDFGVLARGQQIGGEFIPVNSLGVALRLQPMDNMQIGVTVDSVFPDGDFDKIGDNIQVQGGLTFRF